MKKSDHHLIQEILDGSASPDAFERFQERLRNEPDLAVQYKEYALLHHSLCEEYDGQKPLGKLVAIPQRFSASKWTLMFAAAAAVVLAAVIFYQTNTSTLKPRPIVAAVRFSPDAVWEIEGSARKGGELLNLVPGETLNLYHGQASILPSPFATALIEAPSKLTFVSPDSLHLEEGQGRFRLDKAEGHLEVTTPSMSAVDLGTEFGIVTRSDSPDELHVLEGKVNLRLNGKTEVHTLSAGQAGRVSSAEGIEQFPADASRFQKRLRPFSILMQAPFVKSEWRKDYGLAAISTDLVDGENFSILRSLPNPEPNSKNSILLATLEVRNPANGNFHTDGWAGLSFFNKGAEVLFFGDAFGPEKTWALDVKQRTPIILPGKPVVGPRTVTMRYDGKSGEVTLHEGRMPLGPAFCAGKLPVGTTFDEVRIGASSSAALAVRSLTISVGGGDE